MQLVHEDVYRLDLGVLLGIHLLFHISKLKKFYKDEHHLHDNETRLRPTNTEDVWGTKMGTISEIVHKRLFARTRVQY